MKAGDCIVTLEKPSYLFPLCLMPPLARGLGPVRPWLRVAGQHYFLCGRVHSYKSSMVSRTARPTNSCDMYIGIPGQAWYSNQLEKIVSWRQNVDIYVRIYTTSRWQSGE